MASELAKGVYKGPDGINRFWDGEAWYEVEAPIVESKSSIFTRYRKLLLVVGVGLVIIFTGFEVNSNQQAARQRNVAAAVAADLEAKQAADNKERASRQLQVKNIEASVLKMARDDASKGAITGPILSVSCVPVAGGSMTDLTATTTKFECFAVNTRNSDGSDRGFYFNATMDWQSGGYTYGFGRA